MPFVSEREALQQPFVSLTELAEAQTSLPARTCLVGTGGLRVILLRWPGGFRTVPHVHPHAEETFQVVRGRAWFTVGDAPEREVLPGDFVLAERGVPHAIRVPDDEELLLLATVAPNEDRPDEEIDVP